MVKVARGLLAELHPIGSLTTGTRQGDTLELLCIAFQFKMNSCTCTMDACLHTTAMAVLLSGLWWPPGSFPTGIVGVVAKG